MPDELINGYIHALNQVRGGVRGKLETQERKLEQALQLARELPDSFEARAIIERLDDSLKLITDLRTLCKE